MKKSEIIEELKEFKRHIERIITVKYNSEFDDGFNCGCNFCLNELNLLLCRIDKISYGN